MFEMTLEVSEFIKRMRAYFRYYDFAKARKKDLQIAFNKLPSDSELSKESKVMIYSLLGENYPFDVTLETAKKAIKDEISVMNDEMNKWTDEINELKKAKLIPDKN